MFVLATLTFLSVVAQKGPPVVPGGDELDIAKVQPRERCDGSGGDIVVCGRTSPERYRLHPVEPRYVEAPVRAAMRLGGGTLSAEAVQRDLPGAKSQALMLNWRVPIGKGKPKQ
jgi:hypothetical protein